MLLESLQAGVDETGWTISPDDLSEPSAIASTLPPPPSDPIVRRSPRSVAIRLFDIAAALAGLIMLAPLMIAIAIAVRLDTRGPIIFAHCRIGRFGVPFHCLKFRTMVVDADRVLAEHLARCPASCAEWSRDFKLRNDPRTTRLGRFLRRTSLDELPQLLNILAGNMGVVGPRPIVEAEVVRYGAFFADYCSVRPGLTGLWQISGRNDMSYIERVLLDSRYARTKSLRGDLAIITRTLPAVLHAHGCY
jgi:exopolysaccharide production protein ExoY